MLTSIYDINVSKSVRSGLSGGEVAIGLFNGVKSWSKARNATEILFHVTSGVQLKAAHSLAKRMGLIPVTPELRALIDEKPQDQLVLLVNDRGKPLNANSASRGIARYRDRIKDKLSDPSLRLQDTRGTAATRLLKTGLGLNQIANHMGWSLRYAAAVIEHYAAVSPAESAEVLDLLKREKQCREGKTVNAIVIAPDGVNRVES